MDRPWCSPSTLCRQLDWTKQRLIWELQNKRVPCRTVPPGHEDKLDWHDPALQDSFDVEAGEVILLEAPNDGAGIVGLCALTLGIEVLPPTDAEVPASSAKAPTDAPESNDGPVLGYQAARVDRALDRLEAEGRKLSDSTDAELRCLALEQIPEETGFAPPSRQTLDRVIRRRLAK